MQKYLQAGAIIIAIAFIFFGAKRGEVEIILKKAIYICLECVGLG